MTDEIQDAQQPNSEAREGGPPETSQPQPEVAEGPDGPQETHEHEADSELEERLSEPLLKGQKGIDTAQTVVGAFLIVLLGVIAYSNAIGLPFHAEDQALIQDNEALHGFARFDEALAGSPGQQPLALVSFVLNWWCTPNRPWGFHAVNLFLHLLNGVLVFLLCRRLLGERGRDALAMPAGMLFVLHPLNTEGVNYVVARQGQLATLFVLLSLFLYLRATTVRHVEHSHTTQVAASIRGRCARDSPSQPRQGVGIVLLVL